MLVGLKTAEYRFAGKTDKFPGLIYQFFAYPSFAKTFGTWHEASKSYQISGQWQAALSNGAGVGIVIGGTTGQ